MPENLGDRIRALQPKGTLTGSKAWVWSCALNAAVPLADEAERAWRERLQAIATYCEQEAASCDPVCCRVYLKEIRQMIDAALNP